jgi:hypothetical protein
MNPTDEWDALLTAADSAQLLAPEDYDDFAAFEQARALHLMLTRRFPEYTVRTASPELYQDSTGLTHSRLRPKGSTEPEYPVTDAVFVVLSHFGDLATVHHCDDAKLLMEIREVLQELGCKYIDCSYVDGKTYDGKCEALRGRSWGNRYFSLTTDYDADKWDWNASAPKPAG